MSRQHAKKPIETDWLFSCSAKMPSKQVIAVLGAAEQPLIELSALNWIEPWRMGNDILDAYGYPKDYFYKPRDSVSWDSLNDWMFDKGWKVTFKNGQLVDSKFIGEVFLIRDCRAEISPNLAFLVDIVYHRLLPLQKKPHLSSQTRLVVVLAGWTEPVLQARVAGRRVAWVVNPLPEI